MKGPFSVSVKVMIKAVAEKLFQRTYSVPALISPEIEIERRINTSVVTQRVLSYLRLHKPDQEKFLLVSCKQRELMVPLWADMPDGSYDVTKVQDSVRRQLLLNPQEESPGVFSCSVSSSKVLR